MALLLILLNLASAHCGRFLSPALEYGVAKAMEQLGKTDGMIFSYAIRGYTYDAVAKQFGTTPEYVIAVTEKGFKIALEISRIYEASP